MLLEDLQVVVKVAECRSITGAATHLDMHAATASAAVKRVEKSLGVELFVRTTRHLRLSHAGERYLPQCEAALLALEQAKQNLHDDLDIIDGELRITIPSDLGRNLASRWLDDFMDANPKVSLRVSVGDSRVDFYRDSVDMALRYGSPTDSNIYGFKVCNVPRLLCASPEYLKKYGTPCHPKDLTAYNPLFYQMHDVLHDVWGFNDGEQDYKIKLKGNRASNDSDLVRRWCIEGKGLAMKSCLDMSTDLLSGRVVSVMPEFKSTPTELWLICPSRQLITPAMRILRDIFRRNTQEILLQLANKGLIEKSDFE